MGHFRIFGWTTGLAVASLSISARASEPCVDTLSIEASPQHAEALRSILARGALALRQGPACTEARVLVSESDGHLVVSLSMGSERIERRVVSMSAAATWIESWLEPQLTEIPPEPVGPQPAAKTPASAARKPIAPSLPPPQPPPPIEPPIRIEGKASWAVGDDGSQWAGAELSARIGLSRPLWFGAALAAGLDTAISGPAEGIDTLRRNTAASARLGLDLPVGESMTGVVGTGVGVTTGSAARDFGELSDDVDQGGVFVEGLADVALDVTPRWGLLLGLGAQYRLLSARERDDALEEMIPPVMPSFAAELHFGVAWREGGGR